MQKRTLNFDVKVEGDSVVDRVIELSFSSDTPCLIPSVDGPVMESLSHKDGDIELDKLNNKAPLLLNHDTEKQIGVVELAWTDGTKGRAKIKISRSDEGLEILNDIIDGIRTKVSVGYIIKSYVDFGKTPEGYINRIVDKWEPLEISLVSIPADDTVGVGRSKKDFEVEDKKDFDLEINPVEKINKIESKKNMEIENAIENLKAEVELLKDSKKGERQTGEIKSVVDRRSLGAQLTETEAFRAFGRYRNPVSIELSDLDTRAFEYTNGPSMFSNLMGEIPQVPASVSMLFSQGVTNASSIRYIRESGSFTNAATAVSQSQATPVQNYNTEEVDSPVRKMSVIAKISEELLSDVSAVTSFLDARLPYQIALAEDNACLNGTGTGTLKGVLQTAGLQTVAVSGSVTVGDAIFKAINKLNVNADFVVLNPTDVSVLKLSKASTAGTYLFDPASMTIWGIPIVKSSAISAGTGLVGSFKFGGQVFRNKGLQIDLSNADSDDFSKGLISVRATSRLALAVYSPSAFCSVTSIA